MFYIAGQDWLEVNGVKKPSYHIHYLESSSPEGFGSAESHKLIKPEYPEEYAFGRPWLTNHEGEDELYFSVRTRKNPYILGMAKSNNLGNFTRCDSMLGLSV